MLDETKPTKPINLCSHSRDEEKWELFFPDPERLKSLGFEILADCPALFCNEIYARSPSLYLRERATGYWSPNFDHPQHEESRVLAKTSRRNCGYSLKNFLEWCSFSGTDIRLATYQAVLDYQNDMVVGTWTAAGKPLDAKTVNQRADEACTFLRWLAHKGQRPAFPVPTILARSRAHNGRGKRTMRIVRMNRRKETNTDLELLDLPEEHEVTDWLSLVERRRGYAKMLLSRGPIEIGLRKHEICALTLDQWPTNEKISKARRRGSSVVTMLVTKTKGSKSRVVQLKLEYAWMVRKWIDQFHHNLSAIEARRTGNPPSDILFISDSVGFEGRPLSGATLYNCYKLAKFTPWYPHHGRHYFACNFLVTKVNAEAKAMGRTPDKMAANWVRNRGEHWLKILQKQLGHFSEETTELYLRWLTTSCSFTEVMDSWADFLLDGEVSDETPAH